MTYATPEDVAKELRGSTTVSAVEEVQWQTWLDRIERDIRRGFKRNGFDLETQITADDPTEAEVVDVEVAAVIRKYWSVKGFERVAPGTSQTRTVDDASVTDRNDGRSTLTYDPMALTDREWVDLLPSKPKRARAFSVMPS